jgi:hypothetical protein
MRRRRFQKGSLQLRKHGNRALRRNPTNYRKG